MVSGPFTTSAQQPAREILDDEQVALNNINQQIQNEPAQTNISSTSWLMHEKYTWPDNIQDATIPTSNQNSRHIDMQNFGGVAEEDHDMDNVALMEYPLRHSPECVLLRPVPGANTHPDYVCKQYQREWQPY